MLSLQVNTTHSRTVTLEFEHSLLSLSKWEEKYRKPFLSTMQKTHGQLLDYFGIMLTSPEQDPDLVIALTFQQQEQLVNYMNTTPGATGPPPQDEAPKRRHGEAKTAEMIYMEMTILRIPWEAQTWHVNRLLTLIAWTSYKQSPPKKEKKHNLLKSWTSDNDKNRAFFGSKG